MTQSSSSIPVAQVNRFLTRLAIVIAVLVSLLPPLGYLAYVWKEATEGPSRWRKVCIAHSLVSNQLQGKLQRIVLIARNACVGPSL